MWNIVQFPFSIKTIKGEEIVLIWVEVVEEKGYGGEPHCRVSITPTFDFSQIALFEHLSSVCFLAWKSSQNNGEIAFARNLEDFVIVVDRVSENHDVVC